MGELKWAELVVKLSISAITMWSPLCQGGGRDPLWPARAHSMCFPCGHFGLKSYSVALGCPIFDSQYPRLAARETFMVAMPIYKPVDI